MNIKFDTEPLYGDNDKYMKTKIKIYDINVNKHFHVKKIPKEKTSCKCLSLIMLDSVVKVKKKFCTQNTFGRMQIWNKKNQNGKFY